MKRGGLLFTSLTLLCLLLLPTPAMANDTENLESRILEDFNPDTRARDWIVQGSKFSTEGYPQTAYAEAWPEALYGLNRDGLDLQVLGVNARFDRQGYNYIEIIPARENEEGDIVPDPLIIPGVVKQLDLWVWGSNYNYTMETHIRDMNGNIHVLQLGNLRYAGWRNLRFNIPNTIPQRVTYIPAHRGLEVVKFVIWTMPTERVADFYVFLDQIKVLTDTFISRFDGDDLVSPDRMQEIWGGE